MVHLWLFWEMSIYTFGILLLAITGINIGLVNNQELQQEINN